MKHKSLLWYGVVIVLLLTLLAGACAKPEAEKPIKIGGIFDLTGFLAAMGDHGQKGVLLAFEQAGYEVDGRPIEFIVEDGASDPATSMDKVRKLVEADKVSLTIGPVHSGAALGMAGYLDQVKVPNLSIDSHPDAMPLEHEQMFLIIGLLRQITYGVGVYAYEELGYRTATTVAADYVAGHEFIAGFKQAFEERGGKVIQEQLFPLGTTDFTPYIISFEEADVVVGFPCGTPTLSFYPQCKELGVKMHQINVKEAILCTPSALKELGDSVIDLVFGTNYSYTLDTPGNKEFIQAYQDRWGELPGTSSGGGFASGQVALEVLRKAGGDTSSEALHKAFSEVSLDTVMGPISFTPDRLAIYNSWIFKIDENLVPRPIHSYRVMADRVGNEMVVKLAK